MGKVIFTTLDVSWAPQFNQLSPSQIYSVYCRSQPVHEQCMLQFSLTILLIVVGCSIMKLICLLGTIWALDRPTLVALGDAIASFLEQPDQTTPKSLYVVV